MHGDSPETTDRFFRLRRVRILLQKVAENVEGKKDLHHQFKDPDVILQRLPEACEVGSKGAGEDGEDSDDSQEDLHCFHLARQRQDGADPFLIGTLRRLRFVLRHRHIVIW